MDLAPQAPLLFHSALIPLKQELELGQDLIGEQVTVKGVIAYLSNAESLREAPHRTAVTQPEGSCLQGSERQSKGQGSQRLFHIPLIASRELSDQVGGEVRDIRSLTVLHDFQVLDRGGPLVHFLKKPCAQRFNPHLDLVHAGLPHGDQLIKSRGCPNLRKQTEVLAKPGQGFKKRLESFGRKEVVHERDGEKLVAVREGDRSPARACRRTWTGTPATEG